MRVGFIDKISLVASVYRIIFRLNKAIFFRILVNPVDITRYVEFIYLLKFLSKEKLKNMKVLDISSPFIMSYILSESNMVIKSDVNLAEKAFISESPCLSFANENALSLTFNDNNFDFVYSISVVEHIYEGYLKAINEMLRVTKKGGFVYLSFPVSCQHVEEWLDEDIYSNQTKKGGKTFFQYRFDSADVESIIKNIDGAEIVAREIFWERKDGEYDRAVARLRIDCKNKYINFIKDSVLNLYYGFTLFETASGDFFNCKNFGNMSLLIKKV